MKVLVTGATGFIGPKIVHALRAHDRGVRALVRRPERASRLAGWGAAILGLGYLLSCLTTLYDAGNAGGPPPDKFAASPVLPPLGDLAARPPGSLLAEPPFVRPPPAEARRLNYWMMDKRVVTASFTVFATGFCLAAYARLMFIVLQ